MIILYYSISAFFAFVSPSDFDVVKCISESRGQDSADCHEQLLEKYNLTHNQTEPEKLIDKFPQSAIEERIIFYIILGKHYNLPNIQRDSLSYNYYFKALSLAQDAHSPTLICESIKSILDYYTHYDNDVSSITRYLKLHKLSAYDELEYFINDYYQLRFEIQFAYRDSIKIQIEDKQWDRLINFSSKNSFSKFKTQILSLKGVYKEIHERNFTEAIQFYNEAILSAKLTSDDFYNKVRFTSLANIGNLYQEQGEFKKAIDKYKEAIGLKTIESNSNNASRFYKWMSEAYEGIRNFDSAYHYLHLSYIDRENYSSHLQIKTIKNLEEKYQNEKLTNDLSQETIKRKQSYITTLSLGGLLTLSLIGLYGFRRINKLKQSNLQQQIKETEQQGQLAAINAQLDGEEQERKRVAATLHDGIASHLTAASFHLQSLSQQNDSTQAADKAAKLIVEAAERTRQLSHELYPPVLIRDGLLPALKALINSYDHKELSFHIENENLTSNIIPEQETKIYYIVVELLQNVIKHSQASTCYIRISNHDKTLSLSIFDDGIGMKKDETSIGLGLNSIRARLANMSGSLNITNNTPQGTKVTVTVPLV